MKLGLVSGKSSGTLITELKKRGHEIYLVCGKQSDPGYLEADKSIAMYFTLENTNENISIAVNFFIENNIDAFILGTGTWFTFEIANQLIEQNIPISHNIEISKLFKNKTLTKELFVSNNLITPSFQTLYDLSDEQIKDINYPIVVKSNIDLFPVFLCKDKERLIKLRSEVDDTVIQKGVLFEECIEGNDITIPVSATKSEVNALDVIYWSKQHNYRLEGFNELVNVRLTKNQENILKDACEKFIISTKYYGLCRFDLRITEDISYFLEVNSVISIRNEGSSYQSMINKGIQLEKIAIDTYLKNIS